MFREENPQPSVASFILGPNTLLYNPNILLTFYTFPLMWQVYLKKMPYKTVSSTFLLII
jgi:hypothetical protein